MSHYSNIADVLDVCVHARAAYTSILQLKWECQLGWECENANLDMRKMYSY
jgi:hypothetical protein